MKLKNYLLMLKYSLLLTIFITSIVHADTLHLIDGSVINGKIIKSQGDQYLFANSHGTFQVKKKYIKNLYRTTSYTEDVNVFKKLNQKVDEQKIRIDYEAGMRKKRKLKGTFGDDEEDDSFSDKKKKDKKRKRRRTSADAWTYGRLSFSMSYFSTLLSNLNSNKAVNEVLPSGIGANLAYDQGLEFKQQHMAIPGIKIEHSYLYFTKDIFVDESKEVTGHAVYAGLMWALPGLKSNWGYFTLNILPGTSFISIHNRDTDEMARTITFTLKSAFGYEIQYKKVTFQFNFNYTYIIDTKVAFHGIGASFGLAFRLW